MTNYYQPTRHFLIIEDKKSRKTIFLQEQIYSIGRSCRNSIVIHSEQVSRYHGTLIRRQNRINNQEIYWIIDGDTNGKKSRNGIYVNGEKCSVKELKHGDLINFGCDINATFYTMNDCLEPMISLDDNQGKNINYLPSTSISFSECSIEIPCSEMLNPQATLNSQATLNPKATIQGQTYQDPLTQLANQPLFRQSLSIALKNAAQKESPLALMFLDINHFRAINKHWGYATGDHILQEIAKRLNGTVRESDIVARWTDDQFVILFPKIREYQEIDKISQRILDSINQPLVVTENKFSLECSQGIAIYPQDGQEAETLLRTAEIRLLTHQQDRISKRPLNELVVKDKASKLLKAKKVLQQALQEQDFVLFYQPQVNIETGEVSAMEALVRWHHPNFGLIPPHKFIPLAEENELICSLGQWVLKTACSHNLAWQHLGLPPVTVSVNLSPYQLQHPNFVQVVQQVLRETKLDPQWLQLEITEQAILVNPEIAHQTLLKLKQLGINLCFDDFGSASSSLNHLIKFPFDTMKIAQSCVQALTKNNQQFALISAALTLAKSLNIQAVAEGVETQQQLDILRNLDYQEMQGYLFSEPISQESATRFLCVHQRKPDYYAFRSIDWQGSSNHHDLLSTK